MKQSKRNAVILSMLLVFALTGCARKESTQGDGKTDASITQQTTTSERQTEARPTENATENADSAYVAQGSVGREQLTWTLDRDGLLTISGTGEMGYYFKELFPWNEYREEIRAISLSDGVTSITDLAFAECPSLTSVTIPRSVTLIGYGAFTDCTALTEIHAVEDNAAYMDRDGVLYSKDGTELIQYPAGKTDASYLIPDGVTGIQSMGFCGCPYLTSVTFPESMAYMKGAVFEGCSGLSAIHVADGNPILMDQDGILFDKNQSILILYPPGKQEFSYTIPDSVTRIPGGAFPSCQNLECVTIREGVEHIENRAFYNCRALTNVTIPDSVSWIEDDAFYDCDSLVIHGNPGSCAETYANRNNIPFERQSSLQALNSEPWPANCRRYRR